MDQATNVEMQVRRHSLWIWSLLLAIAVVLFQSAQLTFRPRAPIGNFTSMFRVDWVSPLARRVALLVSVLYLLRFLRHYLLAAPREVPKTPSVSYTLTGEPVIEDPDEEPMPAGTPVTVGAADDGPSLLWRALTAIVVALAIEIAADVWALLVPIGS